MTADNRRERGTALIVSLLMLSATLLLGLSAAQIALQEERAARNARDRQIALQAAQAALTDAELDIEESVRSHLFAPDQVEGFAAGCVAGRIDLCRGVYRRASGARPVWAAVDFSEEEGFVPYGHFTGRALQTGAGMLPAAPPGYVIEVLSHEDATRKESGSAPTYFFRITALGFGVRENTQVLLQAFYRRGDGGGAETAVPMGRFGWREIENWQELHNAYAKK